MYREILSLFFPWKKKTPKPTKQQQNKTQGIDGKIVLFKEYLCSASIPIHYSAAYISSALEDPYSLKKGKERILCIFLTFSHQPI